MLYVRVFTLRMRLNKHLMKALPVQPALLMFPGLLVSFLMLLITSTFESANFTYISHNDTLYLSLLVESTMMSAFKMKEPGMCIFDN